ncbi:MAG: peptidoglycan -binding protein [Rhodovibrionaceae bacterium]|nr:peptidoglycan -binding protein [Rhodovibrionaceae bacterium]
MFALRRSNAQRAINIWPGFVDGLASLLLVVIFVLMVFMVSQVFLSVALTGRDEALTRLEQQVQELGDLLALERSANAELRINVAQLSTELQSSLEEKESLQNRIQAIMSERAELRDRLASARDSLAENEDRLASALANLETSRETVAAQREELEELYTTIEADKETIETQLIELRALKSLREELSRELARMEARLATRESDLETARERADSAEDRVAMLNARLNNTETELVEATTLNKEAQLKIDLLNRQLESLRRQMSRLNAALEAAEAKNQEQKVQIADLGRRLNVALASKVQELARYRSEFFGRLREVLGDRQDIRIVGDRFVFQSEVLFETGEAELGPEGRQQIMQLGQTLKEISGRIPDDIDWVLQVEGHTDKRPINTEKFPSNWELSAARAISVVKVLLDVGIPPNRLAASGYAQYKPLIDEDSLQAYRRNRRIELKLTNRGGQEE